MRVALLSLCALALGCKGPPSEIKNRCVEDWPAAPPGARRAPLAVTPAIAWRKPITGATPKDGIVLTDDRIALSAGGRLFLLDRDGNRVAAPAGAGYESVSMPVVDAEGNFVFVGTSVYSVDKDGGWRYMRPLDPDGPGAGPHLVLGPDGIAVTSATDGHIYGIDVATGAVLWRQEVGMNVLRPAVVHAGAGSGVLVLTRGKDDASRVYDVRTGERLQVHGFSPEEKSYGAFAGGAIGLVAQRLVRSDGAYPWMRIAALDACAVERWALEPSRPQWPTLLLSGDRLLVAERDDVEGSPVFVSLYSPTGERLAGPAPAATPWAAGADGGFVGLECDTPGHEGPSRLVAYDENLAERWRLELGDGCPGTGPVLSDEGVLYFTMYVDARFELVAVATDIPGLADSSWPIRQRDNANSRWLR